jgi:hypothetical protein
MNGYKYLAVSMFLSIAMPFDQKRATQIRKLALYEKVSPTIDTHVSCSSTATAALTDTKTQDTTACEFRLLSSSQAKCAIMSSSSTPVAIRLFNARPTVTAPAARRHPTNASR